MIASVTEVLVGSASRNTSLFGRQCSLFDIHEQLHVLMKLSIDAQELMRIMKALRGHYEQESLVQNSHMDSVAQPWGGRSSKRRVKRV